ncbi:multiple epidermal growth factor-like domains protein 6 [Haliotis rubra]|uniref:multiple epidermal growth factor-like domains protein 6 n=1 Tax=Haliotis rubra TaxID=36100 RepID=UPI001EE522A6|nr:multiple epidermal growth factor-like domains protein 6 [Haliotis rubra]
MYDRYGVNYTGDVNSASRGRTCLPWSDVLQQGYTREEFPVGDEPHNYCRNPRTPHGNYAAQPWCYIANGAARSFAVCDLIVACECPVGLFGQACESFCHCKDTQSGCDKVTGLCASGCAAGWTGMDCQAECVSGKYGVGCTETCGHCYGRSCDHVTGECPGGCTEGYQGQKCLQECTRNWYGRNCSQRCGNCSHEEPCHQKTGSCFRGCAEGYMGDKCIQTCPPGRYGRQCTHVCDPCPSYTWCHHVTGECIRTLKVQAVDASTKLLIPLIVGSVLILVGLLIAVFCVIWIHRRVCTTRQTLYVRKTVRDDHTRGRRHVAVCVITPGGDGMKSLPLLALSLYFMHLTDAKRGCPRGSFGWKCKFRCHCRRGSCDEKNGWCESGCQGGKYGFGCQLDNHCMYDSRGINYTGTIGQKQGGRMCLKWSEPFVRQLGYTNQSFPHEDNPKNYCRNPRYGKYKYASKPWCFISAHNGKNYAMCVDLKLCNCPDGLFGEGCGKYCHCGDVYEACADSLGHCKTGCSSGWTGLNCQKKCEAGTYGRGCVQVCGHCHQETCDPESGACQGACKEGYWGSDCTHECAPGATGRDCKELCERCPDGHDYCLSKTGTCVEGCSHMYTGSGCCFHNCSNCHSGTCGNCSHVCNPDNKNHPSGLSVNQKLSIGLSAGLSTAAVAVGIVAGLSYKAWKRHTASKSQHECIEMVPQGHHNAASDSYLSSRGKKSKQKSATTSLLRSELSMNPSGRRETKFVSRLFAHTSYQPDLFSSSQGLPRQDSYIDSINIFGTEQVEDNAVTPRRHLFGQSSRNQGGSKKKGGVSLSLAPPDSGFIEELS